jgi:hypothetical protein
LAWAVMGWFGHWLDWRWAGLAIGWAGYGLPVPTMGWAGHGLCWPWTGLAIGWLGWPQSLLAVV